MILANDINLPDEVEGFEIDYILNLIEESGLDENKKVWLRAEVNDGLQRERAEELMRVLWEALPTQTKSLTQITKHIKKIIQ